MVWTECIFILIFGYSFLNQIEGIKSNKAFVDMEGQSFIEETKGAVKNAKSRFVVDKRRVILGDEGNDSN